MIIRCLVGLAFLLLAGSSLAVLPHRSVWAHDDGLTCHEHPGGGGGIAHGVTVLAWARVDGVSPGESTVLASVIRAELEPAGGEIAATARGVVVTRSDRKAGRLILQPVAASVACSDAGVTMLTVEFADRTSGAVAELVLLPVEPITRPGRHEVTYVLDHPGGTATVDGAILVVSAADGPMP